MADSLTVDVKYDGAARYASEHMQAWVNMALGDQAHNLERMIRSDYLSGQALRKVTGQTHDSVQAFFYKGRVWRVRPGVGIQGNLNYLGRWTGTKHEFMQPAFDRMKGQIRDYVDKRLEQHLKEVH